MTTISRKHFDILVINRVMSCVVLSHSVMSDSATSWTVTCQPPLSMGILQVRILDWVALPSSNSVIDICKTFLKKFLKFTLEWLYCYLDNYIPSYILYHSLFTHQKIKNLTNSGFEWALLPWSDLIAAERPYLNTFLIFPLSLVVSSPLPHFQFLRVHRSLNLALVRNNC